MPWSQTSERPFVFGHRGAAALYPENTMVSFEKAIEMGVDGIETDVHMTKDGRLVLIHDNELSRTTNGTGAPEDWTAEALRKLDAGGHFSEAYKGAQIPFLEELLALIENPDFLLNVEMKDYRHCAVDATIQMLERYGFTDRYVITCFDAEVLAYAHKTYGVKTQGFPAYMLKHYDDGTYSHCYSVGIAMRDLSRACCGQYRSMGLDPWCWCPDTDEAVAVMLESGATLATCNNPEPALRLLRGAGCGAPAAMR